MSQIHNNTTMTTTLPGWEFSEPEFHPANTDTDARWMGVSEEAYYRVWATRTEDGKVVCGVGATAELALESAIKNADDVSIEKAAKKFCALMGYPEATWEMHTHKIREHIALHKVLYAMGEFSARL